MVRRLLASFIFLALPLAVAQADENVLSPADREYAKQLFHDGSQLYEEGRYEEAIEAWEESYVITGYPDIIYNIAGAWERLGRFKESKLALVEFRKVAEPEELDIIDRRIQMLDQRIAAQEAGNTTGPTDPPPKRVSGLAIASYSALGLGVVGVGVGAGFNVFANANMKLIRDNCVVQEDQRYICKDSSTDHVKARNTNTNAAIASYTVGGVFFATGLTLAIWKPWKEDVHVSGDVVAGGGVLTVSGRF